MAESETDRWATTSRAVLDRLRDAGGEAPSASETESSAERSSANSRVARDSKSPSDSASGPEAREQTAEPRDDGGTASEGETALAVVTVVDVEGRAYRRPGAKMLVDAAGETVGSVTPGCLEGPLVDVAADVLETDQPRVETFDLTDDDGWGLGLGCQGVVTVLVEPADESWAEPVEAIDRGEGRTVVTAVGGEACAVGARAVVRPSDAVADGATPGPGDDLVSSKGRDPLPPAVLDAVASDAAELAGADRARTRTVATDGGEVELLLDGLAPPNRLVVFGSQPDVRPVTRIAREAGFVVTVASARGARAKDSQFPAADRVVATRPDDLAELVDDRTAVVLMSHNFVDDRLALESLLETATPYIGLMGPRKRFRQLRDDLRDEGATLSAADRERIAAPVGLDLGGGEPAEIALSIVAEALAALNGRSGGRLSDRSGPIHDRIR